MNRKEEWIEKSLDVNTYINPAIPSKEFVNRLKSIPNSIKVNYAIVPKKYIWAAAASIAILVCVNVLSANSYSSKNEAYTTFSESIYSDFDFLNQV